jgi:xanthine dehydrogenase accessory factor
MDSIFQEIIKLEDSGLSGALATVVAVKGSTPRSVGSKMLVRHDGSIFGSIGGAVLKPRSGRMPWM